MKVGELKKLLAGCPDAVEVGVAAVPDVTGHVADILPMVGITKVGLLVLGLTEETHHFTEGEEITIKWPRRPV